MILILILCTVQANDDDVFCEGDTRNITEHPYDDKPAPCTSDTPSTVCDKRFINEMAFTYHNRIHNIYSRTQCDKEFANKWVLKAHTQWRRQALASPGSAQAQGILPQALPWLPVYHLYISCCFEN